MDIVRILQIAAVLLVGIAAYFFWIANKDGAFVASVLAACTFFMTIRFRAKQRIDERRAAEGEETLPNNDPNS